MQEALFQAVAQLVKADHFEGKRLFISEFDGLAFLNRMIVADANVKFRRKQLALLHDLLMYDDFIFGQDQGPQADKFFVRRFYSHRDDLIAQLIHLIKDSDLEQSNEL